MAREQSAMASINDWHSDKSVPVSTVTEVNRGSTFALRRSTLDFCLGGRYAKGIEADSADRLCPINYMGSPIHLYGQPYTLHHVP